MSVRSGGSWNSSRSYSMVLRKAGLEIADLQGTAPAKPGVAGS
jgi:hypothetical protein